ncbi:MAG: hypothetical protein HRU31_01495 [Rhodobacteraceae bacterium]|nr:hypothetical protein [Paracoccaceae bacterium]
MFRNTFLTLALCASPAFADPYVTCVEEQLTALQAAPGPVDGRLDGQTRAAAQAVQRSAQGAKAGLALLRPLDRRSARYWCRDLAALSPQLRPLQPNYRAEIITTPSAELTRNIRAELNRFTDYLHQTHGISLPGPMAVVAAGDGAALTTLVTQTARQLRLRYDVQQTALRRCRSTQSYTGIAYGNLTWICWAQGRTLPGRGVSGRFVLAHEVTHIVQRDLEGRPNGAGAFGRPRRDVPAWLVEGHANWVALDYLHSRGLLRLPSLDQLRRTAAQRPNGISILSDGLGMRTQDAYGISQVAVSVLIARAGTRAPFDYYRRMAAGRRPDAAFQESFGIARKEFEQAFPRLMSSKTALDRFVASGALN